MRTMQAEFERSRERWARFQAWEADQLASERRSISYWIRWLGEAREMASKLDPGCDSPQRVEAHWSDLARIQRELGRVRFDR